VGFEDLVARMDAGRGNVARLLAFLILWRSRRPSKGPCREGPPMDVSGRPIGLPAPPMIPDELMDHSFLRVLVVLAYSGPRWNLQPGDSVFVVDDPERVIEVN